MFNICDLQEKIKELQNAKLKLEKELLQNEARVLVYEEIIKEMTARKKVLEQNPLPDEKLINIAYGVIKSNTGMKRVTAIVSILRGEGFAFNSLDISKRLTATGKFRINEKTKVWEIVE